jgi:hypothetical protein
VPKTKHRDLSLTYVASGEQKHVIKFSIELTQFAVQLAKSMDIEVKLLSASDPRRPVPDVGLN